MNRATWLGWLALCTLSCAAPGQSDDEGTPTALDVESEQDAPDLLEGDLEQPLKAARAQQSYGLELDIATMRALYEYGVANPTDARPWLLLARDAMRTDQYGFAVRYYRMAIDADRRAATQPNVVRDLLEILRRSGSTEVEECEQLLLENYGAEILGQVEAAEAAAFRERDTTGAERLAVLRDQLAQVAGEA